MRKTIIAHLQFPRKFLRLLPLFGLFTVSFGKSPLLPDVAVIDSGTEIVINVPALTLYLYEDGALYQSYPVAVGKKMTQTPPGEYFIGERARNPTWYIPRGIKKERREKGLPEIDSVPAGPDNPLGPIFIRFGEPGLGYGIHGTNAPWTVPGIISHGCVRMLSPNALEVDRKIKRDDKVEIIYQLYALNVDENQQLWLQKYPNPYHLPDTDALKIKATVTKWQGKTGRSVKENTLKTTLAKTQSAAVCLTCSGQNPKITGKPQSLAWSDESAEIRGPEHARSLEEKLLGEGLHNPAIDPGGWHFSLPPAEPPRAKPETVPKAAPATAPQALPEPAPVATPAAPESAPVAAPEMNPVTPPASLPEKETKNTDEEEHDITALPATPPLSELF